MATATVEQGKRNTEHSKGFTLAAICSSLFMNSLAAPGSSAGYLGAVDSPRGAVCRAHRRAEMSRRSPISNPSMGQIDGGGGRNLGTVLVDNPSS